MEKSQKIFLLTGLFNGLVAVGLVCWGLFGHSFPLIGYPLICYLCAGLNAIFAIRSFVMALLRLLRRFKEIICLLL